MDEADILQDFLHGDLKFLDAITRLQRIGYSPQEAKEMVNEWADEADAEQHDNDCNEENYR